MEAESTIETLRDQEHPDRDSSIRVYEGALTNLFGSCQVSIPYYTPVMRALKKMGCVEQLRRGGGTAPSRWVLYFEPTEEAFMAHIDNSGEGNRNSPIAVVEQRNRDLAERVQNLEERLDRIENFLSDKEVA